MTHEEAIEILDTLAYGEWPAFPPDDIDDALILAVTVIRNSQLLNHRVDL